MTDARRRRRPGSETEDDLHDGRLPRSLAALVILGLSALLWGVIVAWLDKF